jgi:hypothetical protein
VLGRGPPAELAHELEVERALELQVVPRLGVDRGFDRDLYEEVIKLHVLDVGIRG